MGKRKPREPLPAVGWREWVTLPDLDAATVKAKVDTGARTSSLHAFDVKVVDRDGRKHVTFTLHPLQRSTKETIIAEAELLEYRVVKSSGGHETHRPVIRTEIEMMGKRFPVELTLASRDTMGFRMLIGREALRKRFVVDSGHSYLGGIPESVRKLRKKKKKKRPRKESP